MWQVWSHHISISFTTPNKTHEPAAPTAPLITLLGVRGDGTSAYPSLQPDPPEHLHILNKPHARCGSLQVRSTDHRSSLSVLSYINKRSHFQLYCDELPSLSLNVLGRFWVLNLNRALKSACEVHCMKRHHHEGEGLSVRDNRPFSSTFHGRCCGLSYVLVSRLHQTAGGMLPAFGQFATREWMILHFRWEFKKPFVWLVQRLHSMITAHFKFQDILQPGGVKWEEMNLHRALEFLWFSASEFKLNLVNVRCSKPC